MVLNEKFEVVGVLTIKIKDSVEKVKEVQVNKLTLCSSLEVNDFYYQSDNSENLLNWVSAKKDSIYLYQDEGLINLDTELFKVEEYSKTLKVNFKAYDVFGEEDYSICGHENYWDGFGLPRGMGSFYISIPSNWKLVK